MRAGAAVLVIISGASALGVTVCCGPAHEPEPPNAASPIVIQVGPYDIREDELNEYVEYALRFDKALAESYVRRVCLTELLLPKRIVRDLLAKSPAASKSMAEAKAKARNLAAAVAQSGGGIDALRRLGKQFGLQEPETYYPPYNSLALDVARAVFEAEIGRLVGPLNSINESLVVVPTEEKMRGTIPVRRIAFVSFLYSRELIQTDVSERIQALRNGSAWVDPRYRDDFGTYFAKAADTPLRPLERQ